MSLTMHHEIKDAEKQDFAMAVEHLAPLLELNIDPNEASDIFSEEEGPFEDEAETIEISKTSCFKLGGEQLIICIDEVHHIDNDQLSIGWSVEIIPPLIVVAGIRVATRQIHSVDWRTWSDPIWEAGYESDTTSQTPYDLMPQTCHNDYYIELKHFYGTNPTAEEQDARRDELEEEMAESGSEHLPVFRFTKERLRYILPLLGRLGSEHLISQG